jgi:RND superfamily putative drug exporter
MHNVGVRVKTYAQWIIKHRWWVIAGWVAVLVAMNLIASAAGGAKYKDEFRLPNTETDAVAKLFDAAKQNSQNNLQGTVVIKAGSPVTADKPITALTDALATLCAPQYRVDGATTPWGAITCVAGKGTFVAKPNPLTISTKDPTIALAQVSFQGGGKFDQDAIKKGYEVLHKLDSDALHLEFTGNAFQSVDVKQSGVSPELLGFLAALIILSIVFRTFGAVVTPLLSAICALTLGLSLVSLLTHVMSVSNVTEQLAILMVIGVGVDYALFIVTRHRRNLAHGMSIDESIVTALNTSGRAVLFAGMTVCVAMLGLIFLGVNFFYGMAIGVAVAVSLTMVASLTLLPAVLSLLGRRILPRSQREALPSDKTVKILLCVIPPVCFVFWILYGLQYLLKGWTARRAAAKAALGPRRRIWARWAEFVASHKLATGGIAAVIIVLLAIPFFSMRMGQSDQGNDPADTTTRRGYDLIAQGFGVGYNSELTLVVSGPDAAATAAKAAAVVGKTHGIDPASVSPAVPLTDTLALVSVKSTTSPQDAKTSALVHTLRDDVLPDVYKGTADHVYVYGETAVFEDFTEVLSSKMPLFIGAVVLLSFLLLMIAFRSLLVPATAALMNLFAAGASFGLIVAIFQWGWGAEALGIGKGGPIEAFAPVLFFAILFGLSMDYQVFLVSRMHEEWVHTKDNRRAITVGQAETGGIITAAAIIMIAVFGGFLIGDNRVVKLIGLGLASAIFIDAFILRTVLVPAVMHLIGPANWFFPKWLDKITPRVSVEGESDEWPEEVAGDEPGEPDKVLSNA